MADVPELLGGRYEVGDLLGRGGMAEVHKGFDTRLSRPVAIKMLRSDLARDATFLSRFRREAQSAAALNHAAVVAVYDHGEDHVHTESGGAKYNIPYIVMEYVDGRTLREILSERGPLDPMEAVRVTESVLDALAYSHRQGIVHRDIKPANVMIATDGSVKVMDFGIARAMADANATVTATQAVIGTAQYLSPEQAQGQHVDARSDLYSAGCMLFELLTGRPPFLGDSPVAIAYQHVGERPVPPSRYAEAVSDDLDAVVLHALEKPREERYQDAAEFRADLQAVRLGRQVSVAARSSAAAVAGAAGAVLAAGATEALPAAGGSLSDRTAAMEAPVGTRPVPPPPPGDDDGPLTRRERLEEEEQRQGRGPAAWILLTIAVLAALGLLGYGLVSYFGTEDVPKVTVPSVVGTPEDTARVKLVQAGFTVESVVAADDTVPEGEVVSQNPEGNTKADRGSTVRITVSGGPDNVEVPDLTGRTLDEAKQLLGDLGLTLGTVTETDDPDTEKGQVISSDPGSGVGVKPGTRVNVEVASGKVVVPNVVGMSQNDAQRALADANLTVETEYRQTASVPEGQVIEQDPKGRAKADVGSTVKIVIAQKAAPTVTPTTVSPSPTDSGSPTPTPSGTPSG
ncbi:Stk1 family PASTA domain-containing Ser/Thr kinase [Phycicoccus sonneratiae]|uniref:non-specific serine/threonine protein kinase n=1 Tax=Phycicoccus sonneratiae TaxID=2807628 RepID=A0ABS2CMW5_9MICO|nr:Stk1 family PASTA domain-containing Ser/Thr kinase [Phycicoccus sonneraticus]MBM6401224.1 Stk1 family PASTA domain-containing Ser/Thr kinase [Phycicoccus sonneraticus]